MHEFQFLDITLLSDGEIKLKTERKSPANEAAGLFPCYHFSIIDSDDNIVGRCDIRIGNCFEKALSGNIGYLVYEPFRGRHYAAKACRLMFHVAKRHKMDKLLITCDEKNEASRKTCELCGAKLFKIIDVPKSNELYKNGHKKLCAFEKKL